MVRELDEMVEEVENLRESLEVNKEMCDLLWSALKLACERIAVSAYTDFFHLSERSQWKIVKRIMLEYTEKAYDDH